MGVLMRLAVETEEVAPRVCVVAPTGELDLYTCPDFENELSRVISTGAERVVVDLAHTTFIDSTALGVLLGALENLRAHDGSLSVVCTDDSILRVFEVTGLHRVFEIHRSRAEALGSIDTS
jgi:anti-sigma B factor antagonist